MSALGPDSRFWGVIPAGGVGSRLWPLSRADRPKFLHDLTGSGVSLLRATWDRLAAIAGPERIVVVTGVAHEASVSAQLPELDPVNMVLEAEPRDSAAAIGLAAAILHRRDPDAVIGSFAADHVIQDAELFRAAVAQAVRLAEEGWIATIGIAPTEPATGFGYSRVGAPLGVEGAPDGRLVAAFVEKPDRETAEGYLAGGDYLWNAGMFIARADRLLEEIAASRPELHAGLVGLAAAWDDPARRAEAAARIWPGLERVAIDYAVAEPAAAAGRLAVVPGRFGWDDIGDFASIARLHADGQEGELAILGEDARVVAEGSTGIVVTRTDRIVSLVGVHDIVVVDTDDALLVTTREHAQRVKDVVDALRLSGRDNVL